MAIEKVVGTETEYGIQAYGSLGSNPINASSLLINSYIQVSQSLRPGWDFQDETPQRDARGYVEKIGVPEVETHLVNCVLTNGARYYVDHAHPEYSTPECRDPLELVKYDKAGEVILNRSAKAAIELYGQENRISIYKNNSDGKGNSYGCHENYLVSRELDFGKIVDAMSIHFITRTIYAGSGKLGYESSFILDSKTFPYQISQRADFFEELVGLETTLKRPIVNTRDEPHADPKKYRRLHVIVGDANISQVATFLKVGTTALILSMLEDGLAPTQGLEILNRVLTFKEISQDIELNRTYELENGKKLRALDIQWELFDRARKYVSDYGSGSIGDEYVSALLINTWEEILTKLESDPLTLADCLDWVAKLKLLTGYKDKYNLDWDSDRLKVINLQYHDMNPDKSLALKLNLRKLVSDEEVVKAAEDPPETTRAYFRGMCLKKFRRDVVSANWDSLVIDTGQESLKRIPTIEPLRGSKKHVDILLETVSTAQELIDKLEE